MTADDSWLFDRPDLWIWRRNAYLFPTMNLWLSVWLFIHTLSWDAQITFTSIVFIAVEIEGLENRCLRRFPSGKQTQWSS